MPTPTGLPKVGEVWERTRSLPKPGDSKKWGTTTTRFVVVSRSGGDYWSMKIYTPARGVELWVDPANAFRLGELKYLGEANDEVRQKLSLPSGPKKRARKPVNRITWTESKYGGWDGRPGTSKVAMFSISYRLTSDQPHWRMATVLPGMTKAVEKDDDADKLKAQAERWLETFADRIGFGS